jgi:alpha-methylacyl-CoA racemase
VELTARLGLAGAPLPGQHERERWPELRERFARVIASKTRDEWTQTFEGSDACFAPVLSFSEAKRHPHNVARGSFVEIAQVEQPAPAPRFSRTRAQVRRAPPERGAGGREALAAWGFDGAQITQLKSLGLGFRD